jgi:hypothetical protein
MISASSVWIYELNVHQIGVLIVTFFLLAQKESNQRKNANPHVLLKRRARKIRPCPFGIPASMGGGMKRIVRFLA